MKLPGELNDARAPAAAGDVMVATADAAADNNMRRQRVGVRTIATDVNGLTQSLVIARLVSVVAQRGRNSATDGLAHFQ